MTETHFLRKWSSLIGRKYNTRILRELHLDLTKLLHKAEEVERYRILNEFNEALADE